MEKKDTAHLDYNKLGFKCGLEIHQQLEGKKLFCNCPTINSSDEPDIKIERKLKATRGETGEIDKAARFEMDKAKRFIYVSSSDDTCLIDYDEEPINSININAVNTAIKVAMLLNAKIVDEMQIMRKIVVDGSNVAGFQRTSLIAMNGWVPTSNGKVSIPIICLEEEAAQKIEDGKDYIKYRLDRLGIPLIEIATGTEIISPEHAKETAAYIGMVLRSVEGIKRGLGTIRQDVNVSIKGGSRTEIKGFQDLRSIPKVIDYEVKRQIEIISKGKNMEKEVRKAEPDFTTTFLRPMPGSARLYPETDSLPVIISTAELEKLKRFLPKLITERIGEFRKKYGLTEELTREIINEDYNGIFEKFVSTFKKIEPFFIASTLINTPKEIKKRYSLDPSKLSEKDLEEVLGYLNDGKITKEAVIDILIEKLMGEKTDLSKYSAVSEGEIESEIKRIVKEKPGLNAGGYMGLVMAKYRGKIDGKRIMEILKKNMR